LIYNILRDFLKEKILKLYAESSTSKTEFDNLALEIFAFQYKYNAFYQRYCSLIGKEFSKISTINDIPFLPIQFFKNQKIQSGSWIPETVFTSSGTTGLTTSSHYIKDIDFYKTLCYRGFEQFYGKVEDYCFLGLLPSYLEREGSSLIVMVDDFIKKSKYADSGFFLYNHQELCHILVKNKKNNIPTVLFGVSFALLDFAENFAIDFPELIIMETGGMKGRRREMIREELHQAIQKGFGTSVIHSEYGMTELMSQGYSKGFGRFESSKTMHILTRDVNDPLSILPVSRQVLSHSGRLGVLNVIDLGNLDTCSFIATDDLGRVYQDNSFEVLGRLDSSDVRGCNLLVATN
jgi:phenylacetate-coenzyme A ligase PaaK-like adenylate-forming protein